MHVFIKAGPSPTEDEAAAVRAEVIRMIGAPAHLPYINEDPEVAIVHRRVKRFAQQLTKASSANEADVLHERHRWAEVRRHRRS